MIVNGKFCFSTVIFSFAVSISTGKPDHQREMQKTKFSALCEIESGYNKIGVCVVEESDIDLMSEDQIGLLTTRRTAEIVCAFKSMSLSYLRISKHLLKWYDNCDWTKEAVNRMNKFAKHARQMLVIIYNIVGTNTLFEWWLLYLYVSEASLFLDRIVSNGLSGVDVSARLMFVHKTVVGALKKNKKPICLMHPHPLFITNPATRWYKDYIIMEASSGDAEYEAALKLLDEYEREVASVMVKNNFLEVSRNNMEAFHVERLYLNSSSRDETLSRLQTLYDPNVNWGTTNEQIRKAYLIAHGNPISAFDGLVRIKAYQDLYKNMLKIIILRIVCTHALIVNEALSRVGSDTTALSSWYLKTTLRKLNAGMISVFAIFLNVAGLTEDKDLSKMKTFLENSDAMLTQKTVLVDTIKRSLSASANIFRNCDVTDNPMYGEALIDIYRQLMEFAQKHRISTEYRKKPIRKLNNLKRNCTRAMIFVNHVNEIFKDVDFDMMRDLFKSGWTAENVLMKPNEYGGDLDGLLFLS